MTANQATQEVIKTFESVTADLPMNEYLAVIEDIKSYLNEKIDAETQLNRFDRLQ